MRILLTLMFIVFGLVVYTQPISQRSSAAITTSDARWQAQFNMFGPRYVDTNSANTNIGIDSCGALIYTYTGNAYWFRACSPKRWVRILNNSDIIGANNGVSKSGNNIILGQPIGAAGNPAQLLQNTEIPMGNNSFFLNGNGVGIGYEFNPNGYLLIKGSDLLNKEAGLLLFDINTSKVSSLVISDFGLGISYSSAVRININDDTIRLTSNLARLFVDTLFFKAGYSAVGTLTDSIITYNAMSGMMGVIDPSRLMAHAGSGISMNGNVINLGSSDLSSGIINQTTFIVSQTGNQLAFGNFGLTGNASLISSPDFNTLDHSILMSTGFGQVSSRITQQISPADSTPYISLSINKPVPTAGRAAIGIYPSEIRITTSTDNITSGNYMVLKSDPSSIKTQSFQDQDGTLALLSDISDSINAVPLIANQIAYGSLLNRITSSQKFIFNGTSERLGLGITPSRYKFDIVDSSIGTNCIVRVYNKSTSSRGSRVFLQAALPSASGQTLGALVGGTFDKIDSSAYNSASLDFLSAEAWDTTAGSNKLGSFARIMTTTIGAASPAVRFVVSNNGNIAIGTNTAPTAYLEIKAGTATAGTAPLKFISGTNNTSPEAGAMEYNGTSLFFTPSSTRYNILMNGLGLAGGQTLVGGAASGENVILSSTSNVTKGKILFGTSGYNEATNTLGIGLNNQVTKLTVTSSASQININNSATDVGAYLGSFMANNFGLSVGSSFSGSNWVAKATSAYLYLVNGGGGFSWYYNAGLTPGSNYTPTETMRLTDAGNLGIGVVVPTAYLNIKAGTATAGTAPLKFISGTNLTSPEAGAMEYNGTSLFFTPASTRYNVLMNGLGLSGGQTVIGGTGTTDDLIFRTTSGVGVSGADMIFQGGNNGATEFARFLNDGTFRIVGDINSYQSGAIITATAFSYASGGFSNLVRANGSGRYETISTSTTVSSAGTLGLSFGNDYSFSGTTATYTLPAISATLTGRYFMITIKNRGSGNITLNSNAGGNDIYDTAATNSITILPGEARMLINDGTYWLVQ